MRVENAVYPKGEQLAEVTAKGAVSPIVMLNLLKFKDHAVYKDARSDRIDGRTAYQRYGEQMRAFVAKHGGRLIFFGDIRSLVIGEVEEMWDAVALVEYPSSDAFVRIAMDAEVAKFAVHREAGLAGQLLIQAVERQPPG
jgi:uncharacterized protein (DUF1330 family)